MRSDKHQKSVAAHFETIGGVTIYVGPAAEEPTAEQRAEYERQIAEAR